MSPVEEGYVVTFSYPVLKSLTAAILRKADVDDLLLAKLD